ncbi:MAG: tryptophan synthase subunit alpha, partial [Armatimonadetes bacterium]|nr:tryptophan synthase subunit alpha [Armatimonadota bacterium]NIO98635.1 tryptophan synthase subunit alpha [Armatimonadota bacterium]
GISTPEQAHRISRMADGIIVGSRLLQLVCNESAPYHNTRSFMTGLRKAIDKIT